MNRTLTLHHPTTIGLLRICVRGGFVVEVDIVADHAAVRADADGWDATQSVAGDADAAVSANVAAQLDEYFAGRRRRFDLPLQPAGTPFQLRVYEALQAIPYGTTVSYGHIARNIGQPRACQAVGQAVGSNPLLILIPCHRVIAADGSLGGFSCGTDIKRQLLAVEGPHGIL